MRKAGLAPGWGKTWASPSAEEAPLFRCTQCGECCRRVSASEVTRPLDRGDGVCRHFDEATNGCAIYETRPLTCRVDA
ncbi:MAG: YkgJ family cysteine cluster protein, partial [Candidatus Sericytochromatia bacterium]